MTRGRSSVPRSSWSEKITESRSHGPSFSVSLDSDLVNPMLLEPQDVELFFRLHRTLMFFVNQRLKVLSDDIANADAFAAMSPQNRLKVRDALNANLDLIQSFVDEKPANLS